MQYIYPLLVTSPTDVPGALAYFVYKRTKIEYREQFAAENGRQPTSDEEAHFVRHMALPESIASLKQRGVELATAFANELLEEKMAALAAEVVQSELATKFSSLESQVTSTLTRIETRLDEKKTISGWLRDIGTSLISGFGLIVILGAAGAGYALYAKLNSAVEGQVGVNSPAGQAGSTDTTTGQGKPGG